MQDQSISNGTLIDIVKTPWGDFVSVDHHSTLNEIEKSNLNYFQRMFKVAGGIHCFSKSKFNRNFYNEFSKWALERGDLEIMADTNAFGYKIQDGKISELISKKYLVSRGKELLEVRKSMEKNPQFVNFKAKTLKKYIKESNNYIYQIIFKQLVNKSAKNKIYFEHSDSPDEIIFDEKGFMITCGVCEYSFRSGEAFLYKINSTNQTLIQNGKLFPNYQMFIEGPIVSVAKYLSPGEVIMGDFRVLSGKGQLFKVQGRPMIIQPLDPEINLQNVKKSSLQNKLK